jgi:hypothetical protein
MGFGGSGGGSGSSSIATGTDVALSNVQDTQVLTYDGGVGKWVNQPTSYNDLSDKPSIPMITASSTAPADPSVGDMWVDLSA